MPLYISCHKIEKVMGEVGVATDELYRYDIGWGLLFSDQPVKL